MTTYCVTKCPKKRSFSKDSLKLLISLILQDKALFYPLGMKIAERPMTIVSELRRRIEQD